MQKSLKKGLLYCYADKEMLVFVWNIHNDLNVSLSLYWMEEVTK